MKTCCVCGKNAPYWSRLTGPTGIFCSLRCYFRQQNVRPSTVEAICGLDKRDEKRARRDWMDFTVMMCGMAYVMFFLYLYLSR